jgi:hypothetical protein
VNELDDVNDLAATFRPSLVSKISDIHQPSLGIIAIAAASRGQAVEGWGDTA